MISSAYEDFMKSEQHRGRETRFGLSKEALHTEAVRLKGLLPSSPDENYMIADFGTGTALHLIEIAKVFPKSKCWGFEPANNMFNYAGENVRESLTSNIELVRKSISDIPDEFRDLFDLTFSILVARFSGDIETYFKNVKRTSKANSVHFVLEFVMPTDLSSFERTAVDEFFIEVVKVPGEISTKADLVQSLENAGLKVIDADSDIYRVGDQDALTLLNRRDPLRFESERKICERNGLPEHFLSSLIFAKKIIAVNTQRLLR